MIALLMIANIICVILDAIRDNCIYRKPGVSYMRYHLPKWISFYGMQALIVFLVLKTNIIPLAFPSLWVGIIYAIIAGTLWRWFYKLGENHDNKINNRS